MKILRLHAHREMILAERRELELLRNAGVRALRIGHAHRAGIGDHVVILPAPELEIAHVAALELHRRIGLRSRHAAAHDEQRVLHRQRLGEIRIVPQHRLRIADVKQRRHDGDFQFRRDPLHALDIGKIARNHIAQLREFRVGEEEAVVARLRRAPHERLDLLGVLVHLQIGLEINPAVRQLHRRRARGEQQCEREESKENPGACHGARLVRRAAGGESKIAGGERWCMWARQRPCTAGVRACGPSPGGVCR